MREKPAVIHVGLLVGRLALSPNIRVKLKLALFPKENGISNPPPPCPPGASSVYSKNIKMFTQDHKFCQNCGTFTASEVVGRFLLLLVHQLLALDIFFINPSSFSEIISGSEKSLWFQFGTFPTLFRHSGRLLSFTTWEVLLALDLVVALGLLGEQHSLDVGQDTVLRDGHTSQQLVELLVSTDC